tara:strand:+ start:322 stop:1428 length:1107 start_codon:yes stop_codon:yes gene_type:complete
MIVISSKNKWINLSSEEIISDVELRRRINLGIIDKNNVSSKPNILPIFGNIEADLEKYFDFNSSDQNVEGYLECLPRLKGPSNPGTSCFMDSVLMCMFAFKKSPFYVNLIEKDIDNFDYNTCNQDKKLDRKVKIKIQELLRNSYDDIFIKGSNDYCNDLRKYVGNYCRLLTTDIDLSISMHEPFEFYQRLLSVFDYSPLIKNTTRFKSDNEDTYDESNLSSVQISDWVPIETVSNPDFKKIDFLSYLDKNVVYNDVIDEYLHEIHTLEKSDAVILSIDRRDKYGSDTRANTRFIDYEDEIKFDGKIFKLHGVVLTTSSGGHYIAAIKCKNKWSVYNDLNTSKSFQNKTINNKKVRNLISTTGVLFFYY